MRATVPGLPSPHPLSDQLPAVYLEHDFLTRFLAALDDVLAPVLLSIDNMAAHLDPRSAPDDFLDWLAQWVAVEPHEDSPVEQRREAVRGAVGRHRERGTARGLAEALRLETGTEPEIAENGGTTWSATSGTPLPGHPRPWVTVRLRLPDPARANRVRLEELVTAEIPAHVGFALEILPVLPETGGCGVICGSCGHRNAPGTPFCTACEAFLEWDAGPGTDPGPGRGTDAGADPGTDPGPGRGTDAGAGPGTGVVSATGAGTGPAPGAGAGAPGSPPVPGPLRPATPPVPGRPATPPAAGGSHTTGPDTPASGAAAATGAPVGPQDEPGPQTGTAAAPATAAGQQVSGAGAGAPGVAGAVAGPRRPGEESGAHVPGPETPPEPEQPEAAARGPFRPPVRCPNCGTENSAERTLCVRCALLLDPGPPPEVPPPWWRRLLRRRERRAPLAGSRPRRRLWRRPRLALPVALALVAVGLWFAWPHLPGLFGIARNETGTPESLPPTTARASSEQKGHGAGAAFDGFSNRYWAPRATGPGTGEFLEADFEQPVRMMKLIVFAGTSAKKDEFLTQGRPARLVIELTSADGGRSTKRITLRDQPGQQTFDVRGSEVIRVRLTAETAYGTGKDRRLAVAEVEFFGRRG